MEGRGGGRKRRGRAVGAEGVCGASSGSLGSKLRELRGRCERQERA